MAAQHLVGYILLRYKLNLAQGNAALMFINSKSVPPQGVGSSCVTEKLRNWFMGIQTFNESHVVHVFQQTVWHYVKNGTP
jgi:hypothetical protein